jgi:8-oxo-dGTP pyrophosphatase MutT (NUDIX family)
MGDYVREIRKLIGHLPLQYCTATVAVLFGDRMLLQKRTDTGEWGLHGGSVELGEHPEQTARRELLEETGLLAGPLEAVAVFAGEEHHYVYPNGDEVHVIDHLYLCRDFSGELRPQAAEVAELRWFPLDSLPDRIFPLDRPLIAALLERRN